MARGDIRRAVIRRISDNKGVSLAIASSKYHAMPIERRHEACKRMENKLARELACLNGPKIGTEL